MIYDSVIIRYDELGLKGKNRGFFEEKLLKNIKEAIRFSNIEEIDLKLKRLRGRLILESSMITLKLVDAISMVPGISSLSPAIKASLDICDMINKSIELLKYELHEDNSKIPFRVEARRGNKKFPLNSVQINKVVADGVLPNFTNLIVNLSNPGVVLGIDVREKAYIFARKVEGLRGLPVGTSGKVLTLLSGGIDSPVAAFYMMKRGATSDFINFFSPPYIGEESKGKVLELARILKKFQFRGKVFIINFSNFQTEIKLNCLEKMRTVLYRRAMMKIASIIALKNNNLALVTGESLGQVASQTLENLISIDSASSIPIIRPLIGFEKVDVVRYARLIGTYETSILPYPDSCTVFAPSKVATKTTVSSCLEEEKKIDYEGLIEEAILSVTEVSL